jgi:mono/diheme cytochrome c family protein
MKTKYVAVILSMMLLNFTAVYADPIEEGKAIFTTRCAACHNINQRLTGPALAGVQERRSIEWIISFVKSSQSMVKSGDKDAVAIFEQFNKVPMPDHPDLTDDNIKQIVEYIKTEAKPAGDDSKAPFAKPYQKKSNARPLSADDYLVFTGYLLVVGCLVGTLLFAVKLRSMQRKKQQKDLPV